MLPVADSTCRKAVRVSRDELPQFLERPLAESWVGISGPEECPRAPDAIVQPRRHLPPATLDP